MQCRDAIKGLLQKNPDLRLSADDLMHHLWFTDMKTRMKVRPYKPKKSISPRVRRYEEEEEVAYQEELNRVKAVHKYAEVKPEIKLEPMNNESVQSSIVKIESIPKQEGMVSPGELKPDIIPPESTPV